MQQPQSQRFAEIRVFRIDTAPEIAQAQGPPPLLAQRDVGPLMTCVLLDKPSRREVEVPVDFTGFVIEDLFVAGYGIDYAEQYRDLPYIGVVD